jgi:hypothetical protein
VNSAHTMRQRQHSKKDQIIDIKIGYGREEVQTVLGYVLGINDGSLLFSAGHALGG